MNKDFPEHSKISPTAKLVAYWRQFSDVPYASEVARLIQADEAMKTFMTDKQLSSSHDNLSQDNISWFAPMIEARYKSMVSAIHKHGITQVLELASGVSLRGLAMTADSSMVYVETDLHDMSLEKTAIVDKIRKEQNIAERTNLFFSEANVLSAEDLEQATRPFKEGQPVAIIHEGLFQYLGFAEKTIAAGHIRSILKKFGGVWLTPDFGTVEDIDRRSKLSESLKETSEIIRQLTSRDFRECAFTNKAHIHEFFDSLGFEVQESPQMDSSFELTSLKKLRVPADTFESYADHLKIWCLKLKSLNG